MIILALGLVPILAALLAFLLPGKYTRRVLLVGTAALHFGCTVLAWLNPPAPIFNGWFALDQLGLLMLSITSFLFLVVALYTLGSWKREPFLSGPVANASLSKSFSLFRTNSESVFVGCLLLFFSAMSLVALSQHMAIIWVAIEATTLASAPLIYFHRHHRSLEAAWKYLLICSVGIALALLGNFFLIVAAARVSQGSAAPMLVTELVRQATSLDPLWLKVAFVFLLVGFGTKMGLAPMHTWLPDAHSEAPSMVSALLSGTLLNCAFLGILRAQQICVAAGIGAFSQHLFIIFGLISIAWATIFLVRQSDYKRLLAYSSVENMGILALGVGLGKAGLTGALLHAINHSFTKGLLFLVAGNLLVIYGSKRVSGVRGAGRLAPVSGLLWFLGFLAITGFPPFGTFISKFTIISAAFQSGQYWVVGIFLVLLAIIFVGMANVFLPMYFGQPNKASATLPESSMRLATYAPLALLLVVLTLGVYIPAWLSQTITSIVQVLGG